MAPDIGCLLHSTCLFPNIGNAHGGLVMKAECWHICRSAWRRRRPQNRGVGSPGWHARSGPTQRSSPATMRRRRGAGAGPRCGAALGWFQRLRDLISPAERCPTCLVRNELLDPHSHYCLASFCDTICALPFDYNHQQISAHEAAFLSLYTILTWPWPAV